MHKTWSEGSFLKINYYKNDLGAEEILFGLIALVIIALFVYVFYMSLRYIFFQGGWRKFSGQCLFFAWGLLFFTKALDRLSAILGAEFDLIPSSTLQLFLWSIEEGLEMIIPLIFILCFLQEDNLITHKN